MDVVEGITLASVSGIVEEVAILTGHDNDGKLSFRDFMNALRYDRQASEENLALDAIDALAVERRLSAVDSTGADPRPVGDAEEAKPAGTPQTPTEPEPAPQPMRARQSSMAALNAL